MEEVGTLGVGALMARALGLVVVGILVSVEVTACVGVTALCVGEEVFPGGEAGSDERHSSSEAPACETV